MTKIIAIVNQKGGVGKTTTAINLGYFLAKGKRVLIVDMDPQGHATLGLGIDRAGLTCDIKDVLMKRRSLADVILPTPWRVSLALASIGLDRVEQLLNSEMFREQRLNEELEKINAYDYILIDCRPTLGILTVNAIFASNLILVPCEYSRYALEGFSDLIRSISEIKKNGHTCIRLLMTKFDSRKSVMQAWTDKQIEELRDQGLVFSCHIRTNEALNQAAVIGKPVGIFERTSHGAADYCELSREIQCLQK